MPDQDHDGALDIACGGDDCDDTDANNRPGRGEQTCDAHDEDCNPCTVAPTPLGGADADQDGVPAGRCTNPFTGAAPTCNPLFVVVNGTAGTVQGGDCDDGNVGVRPGQTELCNGIDENCDGAVDENACAACTGASSLATVTRQGVDIIWVVENSTFMAAAIDQVALGIGNFIGVLGSRDLDYRVIMVSARGRVTTSGTVPLCVPLPLAGDDNCGDGPRFFHENVAIRSTQTLEQLLGTLDETVGYRPGELRGAALGETSWGTHLRADSNKTFVIVTQDDARVGANGVVDFLEHFPGGPNPFTTSTNLFLPPGLLDASRGGLFEGYKFDGIYGWGSDTDPSIACMYSNGTSPASSGGSYTALVSHTNGERARICDGASAWGPFFDQVATAVIAGAHVRCEVAIPPPPSGMLLDPARINVEVVGASGTTRIPKAADTASCGTARGWYYDNPTAPTQVILCPAACDFAQTELNGPMSGLYVQFGCQTTFL
jgi:hypothetical protein